MEATFNDPNYPIVMFDNTIESAIGTLVKSKGRWFGVIRINYEWVHEITLEEQNERLKEIRDELSVKLQYVQRPDKDKDK